MPANKKCDITHCRKKAKCGNWIKVINHRLYYCDKHFPQVKTNITSVLGPSQKYGKGPKQNSILFDKNSRSWNGVRRRRDE